MNIPFILFHHYENTISCYFHKHIFPDHVKYVLHAWIWKIPRNEGLQHKKIVLKSCSIWDFHSEYNIPEIENFAFHLPHVYILGKTGVQVNDMPCLWVDTISLTGKEHVIMDKYIRSLVNKLTHNTSLVVSPFIKRDLCLRNLEIETIHHTYGIISF